MDRRDDLTPLDDRDPAMPPRDVRAREEPMDATPDDNVDEAVGGAVGLAGGAAIGALAGPVGVIIGGLAGAVGGWWAGRAAADAAADYSEHDDAYYRDLYGRSEHRPADVAYDTVRPAYQLGHIARRNPAYQERPFEEIEPDLRRGWTPEVERRHGPWQRARRHAREAYVSRMHRESAVERAEAAPERAQDRMACGRDGLRSDTTTGY